MHCFAPVGPGGPLLNVVFSISTARKAVLTAAGAAIPPPVIVQMLIDTGASHTTLDRSFVQSLQLQPTGVISVLTPASPVAVQTPTYDIDLLIVGHNNIPYHVANHSISECEVAAQGIGGLLGRDVLSHGLLNYSGPGQHFYLSF